MVINDEGSHHHHPPNGKNKQKHITASLLGNDAFKANKQLCSGEPAQGFTGTLSCSVSSQVGTHDIPACFPSPPLTSTQSLSKALLHRREILLLRQTFQQGGGFDFHQSEGAEKESKRSGFTLLALEAFLRSGTEEKTHVEANKNENSLG